MSKKLPKLNGLQKLIAAPIIKGQRTMGYGQNWTKRHAK